MTIHALVTGTVSTAPTRRTTSKGNAWATFSIRVQAGEGSTFVNVAVFDSQLVDQVLEFTEGAAVSVTGKLELRTWQGRDGQERTGLSITASQLMVLVAESRKRTRKPANATSVQREAEPFGPVAGDLDDALPAISA
jgi:single-stranded DNA-binding protein